MWHDAVEHDSSPSHVVLATTGICQKFTVIYYGRMVGQPTCSSAWATHRHCEQACSSGTRTTCLLHFRDFINFFSRKTTAFNGQAKNFVLNFFNPLTPVPPVTAHDERWPFFHFWRHHLWPKLASSILNFCRRKISFQWCLVHSDWLTRTSNMPKNAQKVEGKTRSQISCHYT